MSIRSSLQQFFPQRAAFVSPSLGFLETEGYVSEAIAPGAVGRIQLQGVSWQARCADTTICPIPTGTPVTIVERVGLVLMVRPVRSRLVSGRRRRDRKVAS